MDQPSVREAASCVDEALHVYRTSTTAWETASSYNRPSDSPRLQSLEASDPGVRHLSSQPLPPTFISQYSNVRFKSFMGLFPQINRAWLTVDSNLFLWSYSPSGQPSPGSDLYVYEGFSQIIVSVALVSPRPGVFVESVRYLIAVATPVDVSLLGVTFSSTGQLNLIPTQISIPTDNVLMLKIISADDGRLFMAGADGGLHQFVYAPSPTSSVFDLFSSRPRKRARKIAHSSSIASFFIPTAVKSWFSSRNELVDLAVEGCALYTLSQAGILTVYDISGNHVKFVASSQISADAKHLFNFSIPNAEREFVSIHPVAPSVSSSVQLIIVTSLGERIYYSTCSSAVTSSLQSSHRPSSLRCVSHRPSPETDPSRSSSRPCVHIAWCSRGAAVFADLKNNQSDKLICVYPDFNIHSSPSGRPDSSLNSSRTGEVVFWTSLQSTTANGSSESSALIHGTSYHQDAESTPKRTFAIAEAEAHENLKGSTSSPMDPPNLFWVLTSSSIHLYERVSAIDRLRDILSRYSENSESFKKFFERYGVADSCAMCLEIAITDPSLARVAANTLYSAGGMAGLYRNQGSSSSGLRRRIGPDSSETSPSYQSRFDVGRAAVESTPLARFSGAHDGITLYLAKVLHPIWNNYLTTERNPDGYQSLSFSKETLTNIRSLLLSVASFLDCYSAEDLLPKVLGYDEDGHDDRGRGQRRSIERKLTSGGEEDGPFQDNVVHGLFELKRTDEARRVESNAIKGLAKLASRTAETLALLLIVHDHQIHRLALSMGQDSRQNLVNCRTIDLAVSETGNVVASSLIEAMFSMYNDESVAMSSVGRVLQERCASFFSNADEDLHRGLSFLRQAVALYSEQGLPIDSGEEHGDLYSGNRIEAMKKADQAAAVLKNVASSIYNMKSVFEEFNKMNAIISLIDLGLTIGIDAERNHQESRANEAYCEILSVVEKLLEERTEDSEKSRGVREASLHILLNSKSDFFLQQLYRVLRKSRLGQEMLLKEWSESVEKFFIENEALDILWKYYAQHNRHCEAATVLLRLAETGKIGLVDRLNFLSCALLNAKTATYKGDERACGLLVEVSDFLDVAKVQVRIRDELVAESSKNEELQNAVSVLDQEILSLSVLFNDYARPYKLYECCLECLRCGSYQDDRYVRQVWRDILKRESRKSVSKKLFGQNLEAIGRQFYPSEVVMPINYIIEILEHSNLRSQEPQTNWALNVLRGIGVPLNDLVDGYRALLEQRGAQLSSGSSGTASAVRDQPMPVNVSTGNDVSGCWSDEKAQLHLLNVSERVTTLWVNELLEERRTTGTRKLVYEGDKAMRVLQLGKTRLRTMSRSIASEIWDSYDTLEKRLAPLIQ